MVRVLVTVEPRMYREAIALAIRQGRPEAEVMLVPTEVLDGQVERFGPHMLVRNDFDREIPEWLLRSVVVRVEMLITDSMGVRITLRGEESYKIEDATTEVLLGLVDEAEGLASDTRAGT